MQIKLKLKSSIMKKNRKFSINNHALLTRPKPSFKTHKNA